MATDMNFSALHFRNLGATISHSGHVNGFVGFEQMERRTRRINRRWPRLRGRTLDAHSVISLKNCLNRSLASQILHLRLKDYTLEPIFLNFTGPFKILLHFDQFELRLIQFFAVFYTHLRRILVVVGLEDGNIIVVVRLSSLGYLCSLGEA